MNMIRNIMLRLAVGKSAAEAINTNFFMPSAQRLPAKRGTREFLQAYSLSPWLRAVVGKISHSMAVVEWEVFTNPKRDGDPMLEHPVIDFLNRGNAWMPGLIARRLTYQHLELTGEAFWAIERNGKKEPVAYMPIPPHWIRDVPRPGKPIYSISVPNGGFNGDIAATEIIWFRDPDPMAPYERGTAIAQALADELDTDEAASKYISSFLLNNARPDIIVTGTKESPLSKDDKDKMDAVWQNRFLGPMKAGKPFFSSGALQVTELGHSMRDMAMVELRGFERDTIVSVYGVPPEKLGILTNSNRSTIDAADDFFNKEVILPRLLAVRETLQQQLVPQFGNRLWLGFVSPVQEDKQHRLEVAKAAPWSLTADEWRDMMGKDPLDGDKGKVYPKPLGVTFQRELETKVQLTPPVQTPPENTPKPDNSDNGDDQETVQPGVEDEKGVPASAGGTFRKSLKSLSKEDVVSISDALDDTAVFAHIDRLFSGILDEIVMAFGTEAIQEAGVAVAMQRTDEILGFIRTASADRIKGLIDQTTKQALRETLAEGVKAGETQQQLANRVSAVFTDAIDSRAALIAETETTRAVGFGANEGLKQIGAELKEWLTTMDGHARDAHAAMDGQKVEAEQKFKAPTGEKAEYPGGFGVASLDVACRCAIGIAYPEDDEETRAARWRKKDISRIAYDKRLEAVMQNAFTLQWAAVQTELNRRLAQ